MLQRCVNTIGSLCINIYFFRLNQNISFQVNLKAIKLKRPTASGTRRTPIAPVTPLTPMTVLENTKTRKEQKKHGHKRKRQMKGVLKVREVKTFRPTADWVWLF